MLQGWVHPDAAAVGRDAKVRERLARRDAAESGEERRALAARERVTAQDDSAGYAPVVRGWAVQLAGRQAGLPSMGVDRWAAAEHSVWQQMAAG